MDLRLFLAMFLLSQARPLSSTQDATCPEKFRCGNSSFVFPFTNSSNYNCGLCMVDCSNQSSPKVALQHPAEDWFEAISVEYSNSTMRLNSQAIEYALENRSCGLFFYDIRLPNSPSISFKMLNNITFFRCLKNPKTYQKINDSFRGYNAYNCDEHHFIVYYKYPNSLSNFSESIDPSCSAVYLPLNTSFSQQHNASHNESDVPEVFRLVAAEIDLQWHLSDNCHKCHHKRGVCQTEWSNGTDCVNAETSLGTGKKKLGVILGSAVAGVAFIFLAVAIVLICRRKKGINGFPYFLSRHISEPSSKPDLEDGNVYFGVSVFSYSELEEATKNFDASKELGDGGFGTVYHGKLQDGREVAVKRLYEHNFKRMEQFMNEIEILTRLRHPYLVTLYGCTSRRSRELLLVYEYVPNGTVADHLHGNRVKDKFLSWEHRMNIAIETAEALSYLHASDIIHRDVKTNNILLDHNFCVKVADFGLSRLFPNDVTHISTAPQGTPGYVDPEYHQCYHLTDKSDVYSFGVVLIELISSMPAVDISRHRHEINLANLAINRIQRCAFDELIDPALGYKLDAEVMRMATSVAELAFRCLQGEKEMRPTMQEVLETLKEIQNFEEISIENTNDKSENFSKTKSNPSVSFSPDAEDRVLLKNVKFPSSPNSVTNLWVSSSTSASTTTN